MTETSLSITEVAFASGFGSLRRFNDAFKERFKKSPSEIRRSACKTEVGAPVRVSLSYRPPYDFEGLLKSYQSHRVGDLEWIHDGKMHRVVSFDNRVGKISIVNDPANSQLIVDVDFPDSLHIHSILSRVRHLFDLHSDPLVIANALDAVPEFKKLLRASPGIRLPSGWDPFEVAIATILGQLVSVERGRRLVHDLIEIAGSESGYMVDRKNVRLFPTPESIVAADLSTLKTTAARKKTLVAFCETLIAGQISLEPTQDIDQFIKQILSIKGIGPWTAQYIALKALRDTDAFPGSDLILARAVKLHSQATIDRVSPWRGYIAALMWRSHSGQKAKRELK